MAYAKRSLAAFAAFDRLNYVVVEEHRAWATNGHLAVFLNVDAPPDERGAFHLDGTWRAGPVAPIDQVLPPTDTPCVLTLQQGHLAELRDWVAVGDRRVGLTLSWTPWARLRLVRPLTAAQEKKTPRPQEVTVTTLLRDFPEARHNFGVNLRYLLDVIAALGCRHDVELRMSDAYSPIRLDSSCGYAVIMPIRV